MKKAIVIISYVLFLFGWIPALKAAECSSGDRVSSSGAGSWVTDRYNQLIGKTYKGEEVGKNCRYYPTLEVSNTSTGRLEATYILVSSDCNGKEYPDRKKYVVEFDREFWETESGGSRGNVAYRGLLLESVRGKKNNEISGNVCFLPAGYIEFDGLVLKPVN